MSAVVLRNLRGLLIETSIFSHDVLKHYLCHKLNIPCGIQPVSFEDWKKITEFIELFSDLFDDLNLLKILWELLIGDICILNGVEQCEMSVIEFKKIVDAPKKRFKELLRKRKVLEPIKQEKQEKQILPKNFIFKGKSIGYHMVFTGSCILKVAIFDNTPVYQLKDIKYMTKLECLVIINPQGKPISLKDLKLDTTLPNLKQLFLINCGRVIKDLDGLKELVGLKTLGISQYNLTDRDLVDINGLTDLMFLYLEECNIRSPDFSKLKQLIILSLINNYITGVKLPINSVLRFLQLNDNNGVVFDTKSLGCLKMLLMLTFLNTPIIYFDMTQLLYNGPVFKCNTCPLVKVLIMFGMRNLSKFPNVEYLVWYNIGIKFDVKILDLLRNLKKLCIMIKGPTFTVEENTYLRWLKEICKEKNVELYTRMLNSSSSYSSSAKL